MTRPGNKEYDDTNRGILFSNADKKKKDTDPDYRGDLNVDGAEFWLSGWLADTSKGKALRVSVRPKEKKGGNFERNAAPSAKPARAAAKPARSAPAEEAADDDLPF